MVEVPLLGQMYRTTRPLENPYNGRRLDAGAAVRVISIGRRMGPGPDDPAIYVSLKCEELDRRWFGSHVPLDAIEEA